MKSSIYDKIYKYISVGVSMSFSCKKGEFDRCFNRLDRPVEEYRPDRQPDRPVDPTGAGRPDWFPSLIVGSKTTIFLSVSNETIKIWLKIDEAD